MNKGRFGIHGGQFIPEILMNAVMDLEEAYNRYRQDPDFWMACCGNTPDGLPYCIMRKK